MYMISFFFSTFTTGIQKKLETTENLGAHYRRCNGELRNIRQIKPKVLLTAVI